MMIINNNNNNGFYLAIGDASWSSYTMSADAEAMMMIVRRK